jgi:uncharacterized membrane protein YdbT with pleckstrin-like domain
MEKQVIYEGSPSQLVNLGTIILCVIFCWLIIPIIFLIVIILKTKFTKTTITTKEIISEHGVLSKTTDELLLKRITDVRLSQPFWQRIFGLSTISVSTTDVSSGVLNIKGVPNGQQIWKQLREAVAEERKTVQEQEIRRV